MEMIALASVDANMIKWSAPKVIMTWDVRTHLFVSQPKEVHGIILFQFGSSKCFGGFSPVRTYCTLKVRQQFSMSSPSLPAS